MHVALALSTRAINSCRLRSKQARGYLCVSTVAYSIAGHHADAGDSLCCGACGCETHEAFCPRCFEWSSYPGSRGVATLRCTSLRCRRGMPEDEGAVAFFQVFCKVNSESIYVVTRCVTHILLKRFVSKQDMHEALDIRKRPLFHGCRRIRCVQAGEAFPETRAGCRPPACGVKVAKSSCKEPPAVTVDCMSTGNRV